MRKNEKGITLIALIITIIVMLILVGVVVTVIIQSNLLGTAKTAGDKYKTTYEDESNMSQITVDGKKYDSIEDYLAGIPEIHNWIRTGDNIKCEHCNTDLIIGQQLKYTKTGAGISSISAEKSGLLEAKTDGSRVTSETQTIHKDNETEWVVLGVEDSNKNGTYETLLLTTKVPTTENMMLYGATAYNNSIEEINRMCKEIYGEEARGITIRDINDCLQYTPPAGMCFDCDSDIKTWFNVPEGTKISDLGPSYGDIWTDIQNYTDKDENGIKVYCTPSYPEGTSDASVIGNLLIDGYHYQASNDGTYIVNSINKEDKSFTITSATKNVIWGESFSNRYWLASNSVIAHSKYGACFGPGLIGGHTVYAYSYTLSSNSQCLRN